jgi:uncharacterized membrane protein YbhN (UPF0104 family)
VIARRHQPADQAPSPCVAAARERLSARRLLVGLAQGLGVLAIPVLVVLVVPGLSSVRTLIEHGNTAWITAGVVCEVLSCVSYVVLLRPVLGATLSGTQTLELGLTELAVDSLVPAGGVGGLALGALVLRRNGVATEKIWRRTIAFFLLSSFANVTALIVVGLLLAAGVGGHPPPTLTILPAVIAAAALAGVLSLAGLGAPPPGHVSRLRAAAATLGAGVAEAVRLLRVPAVIAGSFGYWAFDNLVLWCCFRAIGYHVSLTLVAAAYLVGMLGNLIPLPGGVGGAEGGVLGMLVLYGVPASAATAATLAYGAIVLVVPAVLGLAALPFVERLILRPAPAVAS